MDGGGGGAPDLIRDDFTTARSAGAVNGTLAEPGGSLGAARVVTDLDSRITIATNLLRVAAAGTVGDRTALWYDKTLTRVAGQIVAFNFASLSTGANTLEFGLATTTGAGLNYHINVGLRSLASVALYARRTLTADSPKIAVTTHATTYRAYQVLRAVGQFVFLKTGSTTKFLWEDEWDSTPDLYFSIVSNGNLGSDWSALRTPPARYSFSASSSDSFNRADGAPGSTDGYGHAEAGSGSGLAWVDRVGNATIVSNALVCSTLSGGVGIATVDTGNTDEYVRVKGTRAGDNIGVVTRYVDANNYIRAYHDGTNYKVDKIVAGSVTNVSSKAITIAAGGTLKIRMDGTNCWAWYNDLDADAEPLTIADAALQTGTKHGVYSTNAGNTFDDWYTIPVNGYTDLGAI